MEYAGIGTIGLGKELPHAKAKSSKANNPIRGELGGFNRELLHC